MATPVQAAPPGAQGSAPLPPPGQVAGQSGAGPQVVQLIGIITAAANKLAEVFPAATPMKEAIQNQIQQLQSKVAETQRPSQPQAPPI